MSDQPLVNPQYGKRRKDLGIARIPFQPVGDRLLIMRIVEDKYGGKDGILHKADRYKGNETRGVLCAAGPQALDKLLSQGTLLGDIVWIAKWAEWEQEGFIFGRVEELVGSEDLDVRILGERDKVGLRRDEKLTADDVGGAVTLAIGSDGNYMFKFVEKEISNAA